MIKEPTKYSTIFVRVTPEMRERIVAFQKKNGYPTEASAVRRLLEMELNRLKITSGASADES